MSASSRALRSTRWLALAAGVIAMLTAGRGKVALAAGLFDTELCVADVSPEAHVVSVLPPDAKGANDATSFPVATMPAIKAGDLVRIKPARGADEPLPTFVVIERDAKKCGKFAAQEPPASRGGPRM
jgi:hypothetical protein